MRSQVHVLLGALALTVSGCATTELGPYEEFAAAGQNYAQSLTDLLVVAQKSAIDKSSAELIDRNSFANRDDPNFNQQQIDQLERQSDIDQQRIAVFNDIRKHVIVLSRYFTRLNELATTTEAERTSSAIADTAANLGALTEKLRGQKAFELGDDQQARISRITNYVIGSQQRAALQRRVKADEKVLQEALNTHEVLLEAIGDDLEHEQTILNDRMYQWYVEEPFLADQPLLNSPQRVIEWMDDRRRLMNSVSTIGELRSAGRAAQTLRKALDKVVSDDDDYLTQLNQLKAELEAIKAVVESF